MFFVLSKILGFFALPSNLLITFGLLGAALCATRFARAGRYLALGSLLLLAVAGFSPLGNALLGSLETRFPPWDATRGDPAGIVVLGGAITPDVSAARGEPALNEAAERVTVALALARRYPAAKIVYSGGDPGLLSRGAVEAEWAAELFDRFGLPRERVLLEARARNTAENARFTKDMIAPKDGERWLLVTSAAHMPRAVGAFRRVGFPVEAHPVDWRTRGAGDARLPFAVLSAGLARTDVAVHEWAGLLGYRLTGRTSEFFPGPVPTER
jgi:uncharacterized SAM-binding protein YcdF (DUF218 family)